MKKSTAGGTFRFQRRLLFIAQSLTHHRTVLLAKLDERDYVIRG